MRWNVFDSSLDWENWCRTNSYQRYKKLKEMWLNSEFCVVFPSFLSSRLTWSFSLVHIFISRNFAHRFFLLNIPCLMLNSNSIETFIVTETHREIEFNSLFAFLATDNSLVLLCQSSTVSLFFSRTLLLDGKRTISTWKERQRRKCWWQKILAHNQIKWHTGRRGMIQ